MEQDLVITYQIGLNNPCQLHAQYKMIIPLSSGGVLCYLAELIIYQEENIPLNQSFSNLPSCQSEIK